MVQLTFRAASSAAAGANTDTTVITPPAGFRCKITQWGAGQHLGTPAAVEFQLRYGVAGSIVDEIVTTTQQTMKGAGSGSLYEFVSDGQTALVVRNVDALAASVIALYSVTLDMRADPSTVAPA